MLKPQRGRPLSDRGLMQDANRPIRRDVLHDKRQFCPFRQAGHSYYHLGLVKKTPAHGFDMFGNQALHMRGRTANFPLPCCRPVSWQTAWHIKETKECEMEGWVYRTAQGGRCEQTKWNCILCILGREQKARKRKEKGSNRRDGGRDKERGRETSHRGLPPLWGPGLPWWLNDHWRLPEHSTEVRDWECCERDFNRENEGGRRAGKREKHPPRL